MLNYTSNQIRGRHSSLKLERAREIVADCLTALALEDNVDLTRAELIAIIQAEMQARSGRKLLQTIRPAQRRVRDDDPLFLPRTDL